MNLSSTLLRRGQATLQALLMAIGLCFALPQSLVRADEALHQQKVTPGVAYQLTFEADPGSAKGSRWMLHLRDGEGRLPYDGAIAAQWQAIDPKGGVHTHLFYTTPDADTLELRVKGKATLKNIKVEELHPGNLVLNGDFALQTLCGWSESYNTHFTQEEGTPVLFVNQNGYALSDYIPVQSGHRYRLKREGNTAPNVLFYDASRRYLAAPGPRPSAPIDVPREAAYLRLIQETSHAHLPKLRNRSIQSVELTPDENQQPAAASTPRPVSADWEIILSPESDPREEYAARELRHWIAMITGKEPRLLAEPSEAKSRKIFVGLPLAESFKDDLSKLKDTDGYAIRTRDGNIHIFGVRPRASLYGVHALLERNADIIWPRPNPKFSVIYTPSEKLSFADADVLSIPAFNKRYVSRGLNLGALARVSQEWHGRNGLNSPWTLHKGNNYLVWLRGSHLGYGGSYNSWLGDLRGSDEKVLPMIGGIRDKNRWRQPCYTYPGTAKGIADGIRAALETLPGQEMEYIAANISDNWTVCNCPDCMAPIPLPDGTKLETDSPDSGKASAFFSTRNYLMLNAVAENLAKDFPNLKIGSHAYIFTGEPSRVPVHPMINAEFAAYPLKNERYPILSGKGKAMAGTPADIWKRRFETWGRMQKGSLGFFGYYYTPGFNALADTAGADYKALADFKAEMAHTEGFAVDDEKINAWDADGIEKWVIAKLMWDPYRDPDALRDEYIAKVYKGAEKEMREFHTTIRNAWHNAPESVFINCHSTSKHVFENLIVATGIEEKLQTLLTKAEAAATHPLGKEIITRQIARFRQLAGTLGRQEVPYVQESSEEWNQANSMHWEKAIVVDDFKRADDWRQFKREAPTHSTSVHVMHDRKNLYLRFTGATATPAPEDDRFEVFLKGEKGGHFYYAINPAGQPINPSSGSDEVRSVIGKENGRWVACVAIPLSITGSEEEGSSIKAKFGRLYLSQTPEREESTHNGHGLFNFEQSLYIDLQLQ